MDKLKGIHRKSLESFLFGGRELPEVDVCRHVLQRNGEIETVVLISESILEPGVTPSDVDPISWHECRVKEWKTYDVVPMSVTHQDIHLPTSIGETFFHQVST